MRQPASTQQQQHQLLTSLTLLSFRVPLNAWSRCSCSGFPVRLQQQTHTRPAGAGDSQSGTRATTGTTAGVCVSGAVCLLCHCKHMQTHTNIHSDSIFSPDNNNNFFLNFFPLTNTSFVYAFPDRHLVAGHPLTHCTPNSLQSYDVTLSLKLSRAHKQ